MEYSETTKHNVLKFCVRFQRTMNSLVVGGWRGGCGCCHGVQRDFQSENGNVPPLGVSKAWWGIFGVGLFASLPENMSIPSAPTILRYRSESSFLLVGVDIVVVRVVIGVVEPLLGDIAAAPGATLVWSIPSGGGDTNGLLSCSMACKVVRRF